MATNSSSGSALIRCGRCGSGNFLWERTRTITTPGQLYRTGLDSLLAYMDWRKEEEENGDETDENALWVCANCGHRLDLGARKIEFDG